MIKQYNQNFIEQQYDEKTEMSVEDWQFMDTISKTAELKDRHYYLNLVFRESNVKRPNNKEHGTATSTALVEKVQKRHVVLC